MVGGRQQGDMHRYMGNKGQGGHVSSATLHRHDRMSDLGMMDQIPNCIDISHVWLPSISTDLC